MINGDSNNDNTVGVDVYNHEDQEIVPIGEFPSDNKFERNKGNGNGNDIIDYVQDIDEKIDDIDRDEDDVKIENEIDETLDISEMENECDNELEELTSSYSTRHNTRRAKRDYGFRFANKMKNSDKKKLYDVQFTQVHTIVDIAEDNIMSNENRD